MTEYILASKSPRRKELLRNLIDSFLIIDPDTQEVRKGGETPEKYVIRNAALKARSAGKKVKTASENRLFAIGADTIVVDGDRILGKPANKLEAVEMLTRLRGRTHQVLSGIAVYNLLCDEVRTEIVSSEVSMREYTENEIQVYVDSGDPLDKAGSYAIQNHHFNPVPEFWDCFANVMGLPLCHLAVLLSEMGCPGHRDVAERCQESIGYQCPIFSGILGEITG